MRKNIEKELAISEMSNITSSIEDLQWVKYKNPKGGHGFAAEDANALMDRFHFKRVEKVGISNIKDGADRTVNGMMIQTKYYNTARGSVGSAFSKDSGLFRYTNQKLEIPPEQYEEALEIMRQKILEGKVPGVTNPADAEKILVKGSVTYKQAQNIAKFGTIDSITFDIKNQAVNCACGFGISFAVSYAFQLLNGVDSKEALHNSILTGVKTGTIVLVSGVVTQQFLRTTVGRQFAAYTSHLSKKLIDKMYETDTGKKIIETFAKALLDKNIFGAAAKNTVIKFLRTGMVTSTISAVTISVPDVAKMCVGKISKTQCLKNITVSTTSVISGGFGTILGKYLGALIGGYFGETGISVGANIGSFCGGLIGGAGGSFVSKKIMDQLIEDDVVELSKISDDAIYQLCLDYMITSEELETSDVVNKICKMRTQSFYEKMHQCLDTKRKFEYVYFKFENIMVEIAGRREKVSIPSDHQIRKEYRVLRRQIFIKWLKNIFCNRKRTDSTTTIEPVVDAA